MKRTLKIGLSARLAHPRPDGKGLESKTLQYLEQSVAQWIMARDVLVFMVPSVTQDGLLNRSAIRLSDYAKSLDGLVLQGGADVDPAAYGEEAMKPEWAGDRTRDMYEMELLHEFLEEGKPVLGICRGAQLINVALGGTLYQDIATQCPETGSHRDELRFFSNGIDPGFANDVLPLVLTSLSQRIDAPSAASGLAMSCTYCQSCCCSWWCCDSWCFCSCCSAGAPAAFGSSALALSSFQ